MTPVTRAAGKSEAGHLTAGPLQWAVGLPLLGGTLLFDLHDAQAAADVTATTWTNGVIGGRVDEDELVAAFSAVMPDYTAVFRSILDSQTDLAYDPATMRCHGVSFAMVFDTVTARRGVTR